MSKWRSAKAFCSWLGLSPRNKISGRKLLDTRTCKVINRVATTLRLAAQAVGRTNTPLGIFYRRKTAHLGPAKATTAAARKLACLVYHLLKYCSVARYLRKILQDNYDGSLLSVRDKAARSAAGS